MKEYENLLKTFHIQKTKSACTALNKHKQPKANKQREQKLQRKTLKTAVTTSIAKKQR